MSVFQYSSSEAEGAVLDILASENVRCWEHFHSVYAAVALVFLVLYVFSRCAFVFHCLSVLIFCGQLCSYLMRQRVCVSLLPGERQSEGTSACVGVLHSDRALSGMRPFILSLRLPSLLFFVVDQSRCVTDASRKW